MHLILVCGMQEASLAATQQEVDCAKQPVQGVQKKSELRAHIADVPSAARNASLVVALQQRDAAVEAEVAAITRAQTSEVRNRTYPALFVCQLIEFQLLRTFDYTAVYLFGVTGLVFGAYSAIRQRMFTPKRFTHGTVFHSVVCSIELGVNEVPAMVHNETM